MTNNVKEASLEHRRSDAPTHSIRTAALIAGLSLMAMVVLAGFGNFVAVEGLVTPGDPAATADDILAAEGTFRLGVLALYLVAVLDVVIAWALMRVLAPVSQSLSRLAAWFRLAYAAVFVVAISQLAGIPDVLSGGSNAFTPEQLEAQALLKVDAFNDIWFAGLILFAAHLVIIGYLAFRSGYVPALLGILVVISGFGYAFDSIGTMLTESPLQVSVVTFIGELILGVWLLARGRRLTVGTDDHAI
ncbi:MAG: DUF4386 domain-containing protein [Aeromicrobium sp.]